MTASEGAPPDPSRQPSAWPGDPPSQSSVREGWSAGSASPGSAASKPISPARPAMRACPYDPRAQRAEPRQLVAPGRPAAVVRRRRPPIDDALKVMDLETTDGRSARLRWSWCHASGTQPSEWRSAVLRGRGGLTFEQALGILSTVANKELPKHLESTPGGAHFIVIPAFVRDVGPRLYSIDNVVDARRGGTGTATRGMNAQPSWDRALPGLPLEGRVVSTLLRRTRDGSEPC